MSGQICAVDNITDSEIGKFNVGSHLIYDP